MKAAVIGAGFIGPVHVEGIRRAGVQVKGILGIDWNESSSARDKLGLDKAYTDLNDLLSDREIDCVHVTTPNKLHYDLVMAVLKAGKSVVCEKPLGMNAKQTAELVKESKRRPNQVAAVNYNIRFYPLSVEVRTRIRRGDFGDVFYVRGSYTQDWLLYPDDFNWRVIASEGGATRAVGDVGTHWLDLVRYLTGLDIVEVFADLRTVHPIRRRPLGEVQTYKDKESGKAEKIRRKPIRITTEDYGTVILKFRNGARGALTVSQVTAGAKNRLEYEIGCAKGSFRWVSESPNEVWMGSRETPNSVLMRDPSLMTREAAKFANFPGGHNEGFPDTFKQNFKAIYADVAAGRMSKDSLYAKFEDGHEEIILCDAILESNRKKRWVRVR